ncbi:MAG: sulfite exporter TauE/SafE family protein [Clostridia bacterium]|nr:sulfite exporter TauE/SafE family protein [Clostridia bacterium]
MTWIKDNGRKLLAGFVTGLCNGLFGAGGGMIAVTALTALCGYPPDRAHATALAVMLPLTLLSGVLYLTKRMVDIRALLFVLPALLLGSILGAKLMGRMKQSLIQNVFTVLMGICAVSLLLT